MIHACKDVRWMKGRMNQKMNIYCCVLNINLFQVSFYMHHLTDRILHTIAFVAPVAVNSWCDGSSDRSCMVDPLSYFSFQPVRHDWCNKGRGMSYPLCRMVYIKEPLLVFGKSSPSGGCGFPLSLSEWSLTICLTAYNRK